MNNAIKFVKKDIMDFFCSTRCDVGDVLQNSFVTMRTFNYNPAQKSVLNDAFKELCIDGLIENRKGDYFLTKKGFDLIYNE